MKLKKFFLFYMLFGFKDENLDVKFCEWKKEHSYKQITYVSLFTGIGYVLLSIINRYTAPSEILPLVSNIQLYLNASLIFFISYLAYKRTAFLYVELLLFIAPIYAASNHIYIISHLNDYSSYQAELFLMIFWIYTISGLRFTHSIISSVVVFFIGTIGAYLLYPEQVDAFIIYVTWMSISMMFGLVGGYLLQDSQKHTFIKEMELENLATIDKLTGLYNRVMLNETLSLELERAARYNNKIGVLLLDVDFFKSINDTYGHTTGDMVLTEISKQLMSCIRSSDTVFRWGGEEFIILAPEMKKDTIMLLAENLRKEVENLEFEAVGSVTVSIGASISNVDDDAGSIVKRTDDALYIAKNNGRNCIKFI